ncbi:MAG: hypothetical protein SGJ20_22170 [Planctomycetota bacterium]|nr:hypothetical protein [Planctomycetota bacterium]
MTKILGYIALLTLIVCVLVHLATFVPAIHISMDQVWPLHIAVFALGAMLVFTVISFTNPRESRTKGWVWVNRQYADYQKMKELDARIRSDSPRWLRVACIVSGIYVFVNFALYFWLSEGGSPEIEGAKYFLSNHGRVI